MARAEYDSGTNQIVVREGSGTGEKELARFNIIVSGVFKDVQRIGNEFLHWRKEDEIKKIAKRKLVDLVRDKQIELEN